MREFIEIAVRLFADKGFSEEIAIPVGEVIWKELESRDVRMIKHIRGLLNKNETVQSVEKCVKQVISMQAVTTTEYN